MLVEIEQTFGFFEEHFLKAVYINQGRGTQTVLQRSHLDLEGTSKLLSELNSRTKCSTIC